jgi:hypothetical protein
VNPQYQVTVGQAGGDPIQLLISLDQISSHRMPMGMEKYPIGRQLTAFYINICGAAIQ